MQWATYIPEWVADLLSGLVDIIFAYALYIGMKQQTKPMSGLLITNNHKDIYKMKTSSK